jgi:hypothetical protein
MTVTTVLSKKQVNLERIKHLSLAHLHGRKVYICPRCKKRVPYKRRLCPFCGEKYPFAVKVPLKLLKDVRNGIATQVLHDYVHTYLFPHFSESEQKYLNQYFTIARVSQGTNGYARGKAINGDSTLTVILQQAPVSGNLLILCFGSMIGGSAYISIDHITETNVAWTKQIQSQYMYATYGQDAEIWVGVVTGSASTTVTVTLSGATSYFGCIADVVEYSGLDTTGFLDKTAATGDMTSSGLTGTTITTTQANELWIGCVSAGAYWGSYPQTTPLNGFTLLDGASSGLGDCTVAFLEYIADATGTASSGTTITVGTDPWAGCIATFKAATAADQPYVSRVQQVAGMNSWTRQCKKCQTRKFIPFTVRRL